MQINKKVIILTMMFMIVAGGLSVGAFFTKKKLNNKKDILNTKKIKRYFTKDGIDIDRKEGEVQVNNKDIFSIKPSDVPGMINKRFFSLQITEIHDLSLKHTSITDDNKNVCINADFEAYKEEFLKDVDVSEFLLIKLQTITFDTVSVNNEGNQTIITKHSNVIPMILIRKDNYASIIKNGGNAALSDTIDILHDTQKVNNFTDTEIFIPKNDDDIEDANMQIDLYKGLFWGVIGLIAATFLSCLIVCCMSMLKSESPGVRAEREFMNDSSA